MKIEMEITKLALCLMRNCWSGSSLIERHFWHDCIDNFGHWNNRFVCKQNAFQCIASVTSNIIFMKCTFVKNNLRRYFFGIAWQHSDSVSVCVQWKLRAARKFSFFPSHIPSSVILLSPTNYRETHTQSFYFVIIWFSLAFNFNCTWMNFAVLIKLPTNFSVPVIATPNGTLLSPFQINFNTFFDIKQQNTW